MSSVPKAGDDESSALDVVLAYVKRLRTKWTVPGKRETVVALKRALSTMSSTELKSIAQILHMKHTESLSPEALRLEILDQVSYVLHGASIQGWNATLRYGILAVLFALFWKLSSLEVASDYPLIGQVKANIAHSSLILMVMISLFGSYQVLRVASRWQKSWSLRQQLPDILRYLKPQKSPKKKTPTPKKKKKTPTPKV